MSENKSNVVELKLHQGGKGQTEEGPATDPKKDDSEKQLMLVIIDSPSGLSRHFMHDDTVETLREFIKNPHAHLFELYDAVENRLFAITTQFTSITAMTVEKASELGALKPGDPGYVPNDKEKQKLQEMQASQKRRDRRMGWFILGAVYLTGVLVGIGAGMAIS